MTTITKLALVLSLVAGMARADSVELRSGEVYIGRVTAVTASHVEMTVSYPQEATLKLARGDIAPTSLYALLAARIDPSQAGDHLALADESVQLGLSAHAIAELRQAAALDPTLAADVEGRIAAINEDLAASLLAEVQEQLEDEEWAAARLNAQVLMDRYPTSAAAKKADPLRAQAERKLAEAQRRETHERRDLEKVLTRAEERLARARAIAPNGLVGSTVRDQRKYQLATNHLEKIWEQISEVTPPDDPALARRLADLQGEVLAQLHDLYVALGNVYVQRRALPSAEAYNVKACELSPGSGGCRVLQDRIVQARILGGYRRVR